MLQAETAVWSEVYPKWVLFHPHYLHKKNTNCLREALLSHTGSLRSCPQRYCRYSSIVSTFKILDTSGPLLFHVLLCSQRSDLWPLPSIRRCAPRSTPLLRWLHAAAHSLTALWFQGRSRRYVSLSCVMFAMQKYPASVWLNVFYVISSLKWGNRSYQSCVNHVLVSLVLHTDECGEIAMRSWKEI